MKITVDYQYMFWSRKGDGFLRSKGNKRPSIWQILTGTDWRNEATGRNICSCGHSLFGWTAKYKRLNLWPVSIWFMP